MAAAIIRDTIAAAVSTAAAENASTPKSTNAIKKGDPLKQQHRRRRRHRRHSQHPHQYKARRNTGNRRGLASTLLCADCVCHTTDGSTSTASDSPPYQLLTPLERKRLSAIDNETIDFCQSYSTAVCNCTNCPRQDFKFVHVNSFSKSNISSSTAFEYTTTTAGNSDTSNNSTTTKGHQEPVTPPREYTINSRALGTLTNKCSPLFGPSQGISLRTQEPFYSEYLLNTKDLVSPKSLRQYKENIDYTATEALLSMNGGKKSMNGSVSTSVVGNGITDINRNGVPKHWTIMTSANTEKREHLYKILVIGELGTGKTSFIKRYVHQFFSQNYRATIGVDFALKVLHWDANTIIRLQLWDIAGQERFGNMTRVYYKEAVGAFIVFDVTRSGTFDCVSKWKEDLDSKVQLPDGSPIPCILLANKCDQDKQGVVTNTEKMDEYVKEHGFAGWFETSAKENINIDEAARALVNKILLNDKLISASDLADSEKFNLNNTGDQTLNDAKSKCSC